MEQNLKKNETRVVSKEFSNGEDEIDLIQFFNNVKASVIKNKKLVMVIFLVISLFVVITAKIIRKKSRHINTIIQLDYDGASEGKNFDGTEFNKERLINESVLGELYKKYNLSNDFKGNIDNLKQAISIEGLVPSDIKTISDLKLKAGERYLYTPIQYTISFKYGDIETGKNFLEELISKSNEKYKKIYLPNQEIGKINFNERQNQEYDYYDYIDIFNLKLNQIQEKINFLKEKNYQSRTSRRSYSDLETELNKLRNVEISNYYSEIQVKRISKIALVTKMNYENKIRLAELEKMKFKDRAIAISEVIKSYKPTEKQIIVTGVTQNIRLNNLDDYYSNLVNSYRDTVIGITEIDSKIREYKANMNNLRVPTDQEAKFLEEKKVIIIENLNTLIDTTEETLMFYYEERYNKFIDVIVPAYIESSGKAKLVLLVGMVLGIIIAIGVAYIKEFYYKDILGNIKK